MLLEFFLVLQNGIICFTRLRAPFGPYGAEQRAREGKKVVPLDLYNLLDYEALAHGIIGDGTRVYKGITLQTQSFIVKKCVFIINILIYKYNLKCSILPFPLLWPGSKEINLLFQVNL